MASSYYYFTAFVLLAHFPTFIMDYAVSSLTKSVDMTAIVVEINTERHTDNARKQARIGIGHIYVLNATRPNNTKVCKAGQKLDIFTINLIPLLPSFSSLLPSFFSSLFFPSPPFILFLYTFSCCHAGSPIVSSACSDPDINLQLRINLLPKTLHHHHHFIRQNYTYIKHVKEYSWQDTPGSKSTYSSLK